MRFCRELLNAHEWMGNNWSRAYPYLYYNWIHDGLLVWLSWINIHDNLLLQNKDGVEVQYKKKLKKLLHGGNWDERICQMQDGLQSSSNAIEDDATSFEAEFEIPGGHHSVTWAVPGHILMKCNPMNKLMSERQAKYHWRTGKLLHLMQSARQDE